MRILEPECPGREVSRPRPLYTDRTLTAHRRGALVSGTAYLVACKLLTLERGLPVSLFLCIRLLRLMRFHTWGEQETVCQCLLTNSAS